MAVGGRGVAVQVAAQVRELHQVGQQAVAGGLDLAAVLPQLRRDPREAEVGVELLEDGRSGPIIGQGLVRLPGLAVEARP